MITDTPTCEFDLEETVMGLIVNAGIARSLAFEALQAAKQQKWQQAEQKMGEADTAFREAHRVQTQLIEQDEGTGQIPMTLILVHAQDHLMTGMLLKEMVTEMIELHQKIAQLG
ncbi:PTS lactose/cellobiose transporter subunit IIA [Dongshaea marina]|uniref:PTS lactose/cellobiose transporter subunit IIA n=1 Tax=Dongshaea marina TaxID=2047966 RepID=UPI00131F1E34|nr:PTS lactose/cellobiose transporter subunit IIA [Dongshaea marina]